MKILVVDDNEIIQSILLDVLSVDGYDTKATASLNEAVEIIESFKPDAILLDSKIGSKSGLNLIDMAVTKELKLNNVIVLISGKDQVPKDSLAIIGTVKKPFKAEEILEMLRSVFKINASEKPRRAIMRSIFGKRTDSSEDDIKLKFGRSYVFKEKDSNHIYTAASRFAAEGYSVFAVTSGKKKAVKERFEDGIPKAVQMYDIETKPEEPTIIALSSKTGDEYVDPARIGTLMSMMIDFINVKEKPVIVLDELELLIHHSGLNAVITMIHQVVHSGIRPITFIVSVNTLKMTDKDRELLLDRMEYREFED